MQTEPNIRSSIYSYESPHSNDPESAFEELVLADKLFELQDERP
jgi:hypothetical protein